MYLSYYNLKRKPFQVSTDPKFLWLGQKHKDALATMTYGILYNYGYILITGDVGTGKTTLVNALIEDLGDEVVLAKINDPGLEALDFFNLILSTFKIVGRYTTKGTFLTAFNKFLQSCCANGKKVVLIIDEAQRLSPELLEDIRHLSNIEKEILNIVFVGQDEFNDRLLDERNRALRQRIGINYHIDPLTEEETKEYIAHRLEMAGSRGRKFTVHAIREIFLFSGGIPRLINIVCDRALLSGYVKQQKLLGADIIRECGEELRLPGEGIPVLGDEIEPHALATEEEVSLDWDLSAKDAEVHTEELEPHALMPEKTFLSPAVYVIPVIALLLVLTGYLHDPGLYTDFIKSFESNDVKQQIAAELPSTRVEKPVAEILAPKDNEPVRMSKIKAEDTGADDVGTSAAPAEEASLEKAIVDVDSGSRPSSDGPASILDVVGPAVASTAEASLENTIVDNTPEPPTEETAPIQNARSDDAGQASTFGEQPGAPDPGEVIDWLLKKRSEN